MCYNPRRLGSNIRYLRKKRRLSINNLAELASITPSFLGLVERGERGLSVENLCKISIIFSVTLDKLVFESLFEDDVYAVREIDGSELISEINAYLHGMTQKELDFIAETVRSFRNFTKNIAEEADESNVIY